MLVTGFRRFGAWRCSVALAGCLSFGPLAWPVQLAAGASADAWTRLPVLSSRGTHSAIFDAPRNRMLVFGGMDDSGPFDDLWSLSLVDSVWTRLVLPGTSPTARNGHTAVYDARRERMLVYGGRDTSGALGDVWQLGLADPMQWTLVQPQGEAPPSRFHHAAVYDAVHDRMLVHGGVSSAAAESFLWALELDPDPVWRPVAVRGYMPRVRAGHSLTLEAGSSRMWLVGGLGSLAPGDTVWTFDLAIADTAICSWTAPSGRPRARHFQSVVHDSAASRLVVMGGYDNTSLEAVCELWALSTSNPSAWSPLHPASADCPEFGLSRAAHSAVMDSTGHMIVFGGQGHGDAWALALRDTLEWQGPLGRNGPPDFSLSPITYDAVRSSIWMATGDWLWRLDARSAPGWERHAVLGPRPTACIGARITHDPVRDRLLRFGGTYCTAPGGQSNELWALSLGSSPTWEQLAPSGPLPPVRDYASFVYDRERDAMLLFGGYAAGQCLNDLWMLELAGELRWVPLSVTGPVPDARAGHSMVHDRVRDRMVLYGGNSVAPNQTYGDVWYLSLDGTPAWEAVSTAGTMPLPRTQHAAVFDSIAGRLLVFSGYGASYQLGPELWELSCTESPPVWRLVAPSGGPPAGRSMHAAGLLAEPRQLLIWGGGYSSSLNDAWLLSLDHPTPTLVTSREVEATANSVRIRWTLSASAIEPLRALRQSSEPAWEHLDGLHLAEDGKVTLEDASVRPGERYRYRLAEATSGAVLDEMDVRVPVSPDLDLRPAPGAMGSGPPEFVVVLPSSHPATLEVFDAQGRRLVARDLEGLRAGEHRISLTESQRWKSGVHWARLTQDRTTATRRFILVR